VSLDLKILNFSWWRLAIGTILHLFPVLGGVWRDAEFSQQTLARWRNALARCLRIAEVLAAIAVELELKEKVELVVASRPFEIQRYKK